MSNRLNKSGDPRRMVYEPDASYKRRVWFVKKYGGGGGVSEAVRLSNIWVNMILLHCRYPEKLEKMVHTALKGMGNGMGKQNNIRV